MEYRPNRCRCHTLEIGILMNASINTLRPRQNGRHFADDIFKCIFLNENVWIPIKVSLKFVPKDPINNIPAMVQIMAWRRPADKPLSEPVVVSLPTHICVVRPQWVNALWATFYWYLLYFINAMTVKNVFSADKVFPKNALMGYIL